ncbi:MAG: aspartate-semialdehyde dehydrogenase [Gammaproteobacteria bacterium]|nr:MAG: aspartate-semialdehyde dehydrogenase [Gammaproteobacteria bacterium]
MSEQLNIAVVGATGAVGEAMLSILAEYGFGDANVHALASERSLGKTVDFGRRYLAVEVLDDFDFAGCDFALFSAGGGISLKYAPRAAEAGCTVIDNTSAFRLDPEIPLVVPEINGDLLENLDAGSIIANPNCSTIQMLIAIAPIYAIAGINRINVATYQSVSGAGSEGMEELARQTMDRLSFKDVKPSVFAQPIAFNAIPVIDTMQDNDYTREEMKLHWETCKILRDDSIGVNATAVRIPVFYGHSEAVHLETSRDISMEEVREAMHKAAGLVLIDDTDPKAQVTAVTHAAGKDEVFVSRLRRDHSHPRGINLWVVGDNVRKGAALNAVQILKMMVTGKMPVET